MIDDNIPVKRTPYKEKPNYWVLLLIPIIPFVIFMPIILSNLNPDMKIYESDFQKVIDDPNAKCFNLKLVVVTAGNGMWSLDPEEYHLHKQAQDRIDKGNCKNE